MDMQCVQYREALSARLDGEPLGVSTDRLDEHLRDCPECASWYAAAARVTRLIRVAPAPSVPDLSDRILAAAAAAGTIDRPGAGPDRAVGRPGRPGWPGWPSWPGWPGWLAAAVRTGRVAAILRAALAVVAVGQAAIGWPALALGADTMQAPVHVAHESGAWNVAVAVALLAVVRRPRYATGLLPLLAAVVTALAVTTLSDLAAGGVHADRFTQHLFLVAGLLLVAAISRLTRQPQTPPMGGRGRLAAGSSGADADAEFGRRLDRPGQLPAMGESRHRPATGESPAAGGPGASEEVA
jgi:predicted anti-sigma-YlaC factor YlaD